MGFPAERPRRLRRTERLRDLVAETSLSAGSLVQPWFVRAGREVRAEIASMPGIAQLSPDLVAREAADAFERGVGGAILFGIPETKDGVGSSAWDEGGPVPLAIRAIKEAAPDFTVFADVCLCEYTDHGHCGLLDEARRVDNDRSLEPLARAAVAYARAGADAVAPSDMMDGRVGAIRKALDREGFPGTAILAYSAKYASAFYGPFRDAAESPPRFGDRRSYQMDARNLREALREVRLDVEEGADLVMVKPALGYLDVVHAVREAVDVPVAAYSVSGEYAMVEAAAARGMLDRKRAILEILHSIRRAGADLVLTYWAREAAAWV